MKITNTKPTIKTPSYPDWDQFDPNAYIGHNYEKVVLSEDQLVISRLIERIDELAFRPYSMQKVLNVGHGAVFAADAVIQYLLGNTGAYDLVEYGKKNIACMQETIAKGLEGDKGIWGKFEEFAADKSSTFKDGLLRAWQLSHVIQGSIYDLSNDVYDAGFTFYCPESITNDIFEFEKAVHSFVGSVKKDGLIMLAFIRGSEGYATPGQFFPAVSVECDDVHYLLSSRVKRLEVIPIKAPGMRPANGPQAAGIGLATGIRR